MTTAAGKRCIIAVCDTVIIQGEVGQTGEPGETGYQGDKVGQLFLTTRSTLVSAPVLPRRCSHSVAAERHGTDVHLPKKNPEWQRRGLRSVRSEQSSDFSHCPGETTRKFVQSVPKAIVWCQHVPH